MKALILNSGIGSRLMSKNKCKCLTELAPGTAILDLQITAMLRCMIDDIYITTGPYAAQLEEHIRAKYSGDCTVTFIHNPLFEETNYIYSMQLAGDYLRGSGLLLMHGDLVFEQNVLQDILASEGSVMVSDSGKPLPEKDFKAMIGEDGRICKIGIDVFENAQYAQPLYKLSECDWALWSREIDNFCRAGKTGVYAENAFNDISGSMDLRALDIKGRVCFEVDTDEDLEQAREAYKKMPGRLQTVYAGCGSRKFISDIINKAYAEKPFVACGIGQATAQKLIGNNAIYHNITKPNPEFNDIEAVREIFIKEKCDFIISIGGGSAIDTAKCVKYANPGTGHLAIPTSAGTGSESTQFAVVYKDMVKQSLEDTGILPDYVILDPYFLSTLPLYHKKSTLLDAMCQATESLWAKGKTDESMSYARAALRIFNQDAEAYLTNDIDSTALRMLFAANLSGKAINISKTTAAHAMSYMLSSMYGIAHGHAAAMCLIPVWKNLLDAGEAPEELSWEQYKEFIRLYESMELKQNIAMPDDLRLQRLTDSVNMQRLSNHPVELTQDEIKEMYSGIFINI